MEMRARCDIEEAWVVSCADVEPINLAAAVKADNPALTVLLVDFEGSGSLRSRAREAEIDAVLDRASFVQRYGQMKQRNGRVTVLDAPRVTIEQVPPATLALPERAPLAAVSRSGGMLIPVVGGSGGVGKSSVATVAACLARNRGKRRLLLDFDLQFGDIALMAGQGTALAIDEAVALPMKLEQELAKQAPLTVLAAPARLEAAEAVVKAAPALLARLCDAYEVIIANTGAAWAEQHAVLLERSSAALFLVDQRASSLRACRHALELCARCGIATGPFHFALNRCAKGAPFSAADASSALQGAVVHELRDGGRDVEEYLSAGAPDDLIASGNEFCLSVGKVLDELLPPTPATASPLVPRTEERGAFGRRARHAARKRGKRS